MSDSSKSHSKSNITNKIFNVIKLNPDYEKKAEETYEYFRIESPDERFEIDVKDLPDEVIKDLDSYIKDCETVDEKYDRLNEPFVNAITQIFKKYKSKILETKEHNREEAEQAFTRLSPSISNQWMLTNIHQISLPDSLIELIGYVPPYSKSSSKDEVKNVDHKNHKLQKDSKKKKIESNENKKEEPQDQGNEISNLLTTVKGRCIEIFKDQINRFYVTLWINDHAECIELQSSRFKNIVRKEYFEIEKKLLSDDKLDGIMSLIEADLMFNEDIKIIDLLHN